MDVKGMMGLLQNAGKMKEEFSRIQDSLADKTVEAASGGGMVKVKVNGKLQVVSIRIEPEVLQRNDAAMLEDLLVAGVNEGLRSAQELVTQEMGKLTAGLGPLAAMFGKGM